MEIHPTLQLPDTNSRNISRFFYFVLGPTNVQLIHKLSHYYMFRHYRTILREPVISTLPSYKLHLNFKLYYQQLHFKYLGNLERY